MTTNQIDDGGPAFPQPLAFSLEGVAHIAAEYFPNVEGMSLRDWLAGQASEEDIEEHRGVVFDAVLQEFVKKRSREAAKYAYADAMLAARKGGSQ